MKKEIRQPNNQRELVLYYLITRKEISTKDAINDSMFFKFNTRLSELECDLSEQIANRREVKFTNRFGHNSSYLVYSAVDKEKLIEMYNAINE